MQEALSKHFSFAEVEKRIYQEWEDGDYFKPQGEGEAFTVVIPPPNVTGSLHIGHALNNTIQDVMIRYHRMRGFRVLWQPGTDHAGIATQMVVERNLAKEGIERRSLGKEKFVEKVWEWKEHSEQRILYQLRKLGASCDWSRQRFTLDEGLSEAVREVFVRMYEAGLIYKDKRLVNWDPVLETAISDLEIVTEESKGKLWYIRYEGVECAEDSIVIATTRPETMWGDSAVAVHPDDERYQHLIGKKVRIPVVEREVMVIADEAVEKDQGSGALKVTPAHDHTDFTIGRRHHLEFIEIFTKTATLKESSYIKKDYQGLSREEVRKKLLAELELLDVLEKVEGISHSLPRGDRSKAVIEPYLSEQWYVDASSLAQPAITAVEQEEIQFVPSFWKNTYFSWMRNIEPWCISRQLWWGHAIPAWYGPDGTVFVAKNEEAAQEKAHKYYGESVELTPDEDVLDTWFSSALWPFSTLGWPQNPDNEILRVHYPTSVLLTGFDIIFFWVARMIMAGYFTLGQKPFHTVYVHALVKDIHGQKMSKSKGNVLDPIDLVEHYGCDALRFALLLRASPGRDIKIGDKEVTLSRNFVTKIWNAARFCQQNGVKLHKDVSSLERFAEEPLHNFMLTKLHLAGKVITESQQNYRFDLYAEQMYHLIWDDFCDQYIEWCKIGEQAGEITEDWREVAGYVLGVLLHWLHPVMPFISEEIWRLMGGSELLIAAKWPLHEEMPFCLATTKEMEDVMQIITTLRALLAEEVLSRGDQVVLQTHTGGKQAIIATHAATMAKLSRVAGVSCKDEIEEVTMVLQDTSLLHFSNLPQVAEKMIENLQKEEKTLLAEQKRVASRLHSPKFLEKASAEAIEDTTKRSEEVGLRLALIAANIERLSTHA